MGQNCCSKRILVGVVWCWCPSFCGVSRDVDGTDTPACCRPTRGRPHPPCGTGHPCRGLAVFKCRGSTAATWNGASLPRRDAECQLGRSGTPGDGEPLWVDLASRGDGQNISSPATYRRDSALGLDWRPLGVRFILERSKLGLQEVVVEQLKDPEPPLRIFVKHQLFEPFSAVDLHATLRVAAYKCH